MSGFSKNRPSPSLRANVVKVPGFSRCALPWPRRGDRQEDRRIDRQGQDDVAGRVTCAVAMGGGPAGLSRWGRMSRRGALSSRDLPRSLATDRWRIGRESAYKPIPSMAAPITIRLLWANTDNLRTWTISRRVHFVHINSVRIAVKIAAVQHAQGTFRSMVTAFDPTTSVERQLPNREFRPTRDIEGHGDPAVGRRRTAEEAEVAGRW